MGTIKEDVLSVFLSQYPEQRTLLKPFLSGFDISYAERKLLNNTTLFVYLLKPEEYISDAFGISKEILLAYTPYDTLQPRAIQAVNMVFDIFPFRNRVDTLNCFVVSKDFGVLEYAGITNFSAEQSRCIVPFVYDELLQNANDSWFVRNQLRKYFYDIDLFGYTLPLRDETSFFGRQQIIARYVDAIRRCENRGIFGVRKTGKTSLLFKIDRIIREQHIGFVFFYDCKSPSYRRLHWNELLGEICDNIAKRLKIRIRKEYDETGIIKSFRYVVHEAALRNKKIIIMFDEIEYISFKSTTDVHWQTEFVDFWQAIWSVQSIHRNLVFILSGVNPSVTEVDTVNGIQNPLFSIVQSEYLQGLSEEDAHTMIRTLGRRMGIRVEHSAVTMLYKQFNGHPMLLRLACSYINRQYSMQTRPITITENKISDLQEGIDIELAYYFKHIVSEIKQFYPDEYEMFEMLASGQISDFVELSSMVDFSRHLYSYGLVAKDDNGTPIVNMPVAGRYVAMELAKKENRTALYRLVEKEKRRDWVTQRARSIIRDLRQLETAIRSTNKHKLFGENSFPEAEKFAGVTPVVTEADFANFFNICNRCFVESVENYGNSISCNNYFWNEIKVGYPTLHGVLHRMKIYRHSQDHLKLEPTVAAKYSEFWSEDTSGFTNEEEQRFAVQQKLLESFLTAIQVEISTII